uniref:S1 motif domain-containing protein n=1 Tax=Ciona savignyi TaxID=51511 RepID=H2Y862_CIOSA
MEECRDDWDITQVLCEKLNLDVRVVKNLIQLLEVEECTVPFMARYRKERTGGMEANKLRQFLNTLNELRDVQKKAVVAIKNLEKLGCLDSTIEAALKSAQSIDEINHMIAPYKMDKKSLASRARALGLDDGAKYILNNPRKATDLRKWVKRGCEGLATLSLVENGVKHILCEAIAKDKETILHAKQIFRPNKKSMKSDKTEDKASTKKYSFKFQNYYDFLCLVSNLRSYQILAINRGETLKELTVKIVIDEKLENSFLSWCQEYWVERFHHNEMRKIMQSALTDSFNRLLKPKILRQTRAELTRRAQTDSIDVFGRNLKKLLLTSPVRGKVILGIDPGFKNGCKCAVLSQNGMNILVVDVFYLSRYKEAKLKLTQMLNKFNFQVIGIGNGTACRETEQLVSQFITESHKQELVYCIVNESGASIYSVTAEAKQEMPEYDPNLRSAVSIARRLQDPLVELVKIDPKHLGVGMYQHDIPDTLMKAALSSVVEDCVTFVGVDINMAGESLLKRVAGLKKTQVNKILEWRNKNGPFINRNQLLEVPGVGNKTFQQCAGFIRIGSAQENLLNHQPNPLDQTWIHPESYELTEKFLKIINLDSSRVGQDLFISQLKSSVRHKSIRAFSNELGVGEPTLQLIVDGLSAPGGYRDIRSIATHLYKKGICSLNDLKYGITLQGRVTNVVDFGVFVDIGVEKDALIHCSEMGNKWLELREVLGPNDTVSVMVQKVDPIKKYISLKLIKVEAVD